MIKTITIITSILFTLSLSAQIIPGQNNPDLKVKYDKVILSGNEDLSHLMVNPNPHTYPVLSSNSKSTITSEVIGWTTYDLQSNGSIQNRIVVHDDGTISAAWTMSTELNSAWSDRGTGYNHFDGSNWTFPAPSPPFSEPRLEDSRVGWPSLIALGNGGERVMTHSTDNNVLNQASRTSIGTGTWTNSMIGENYLIWNRSAAGGLDGNTIHTIALTEPSGGTWTGSLWHGLNGAVLYSRSQDGGNYWDIDTLVIPGMDSSSFLGFSADDYAIAAQGETVVIAYFNAFGDSFIMKSTDNGDNWAKTIFLDFPVDKYVIDSGIDLDGDAVLDADGNQVVTLGLKSIWVAKTKTTANSLLASSDWYVTRKSEKSTAIPSNISTHRDAVRTKQASMETAITNAADTAALETLYTVVNTGTEADPVYERPLGELPRLES